MEITVLLQLPFSYPLCNFAVRPQPFLDRTFFKFMVVDDQGDVANVIRFLHHVDKAP